MTLDKKRQIDSNAVPHAAAIGIYGLKVPSFLGLFLVRRFRLFTGFSGPSVHIYKRSTAGLLSFLSLSLLSFFWLCVCVAIYSVNLGGRSCRVRGFELGLRWL